MLSMRQKAKSDILELLIGNLREPSIRTDIGGIFLWC
jgi:hypothetical protein